MKHKLNLSQNSYTVNPRINPWIIFLDEGLFEGELMKLLQTLLKDLIDLSRNFFYEHLINYYQIAFMSI